MRLTRKLNWLFFLNNKGETENTGKSDEEDTPSELETALENQLGDEEQTPEKKKGEETLKEEGKEEKSDEQKAMEEKENLIDVEGYKGKNRRGKGFEGEERRTDILDKRNNIELDFEYGKEKAKKISMEEVKTTFKWLQDNTEQIAAGMSINKFSQKYPDFGKVISAVVSGSFNDKNEFNNEFATKILKAVEAKEEVIEEQKDEIDKEIDKIQKILDDDEIDKDSAQAIALKSSMASMKFLKKRLTATQTSLNDVTKKFEGIETTQKNAVNTDTKKEYQAEVKRIGGLLTAELQSLTDEKKEDGYKFYVDSERKEFNAYVIATVQKSVADLKLKEGEKFTDEQFKKFVGEGAKAAYGEVLKKREAITQAYILKKNGGKEPPKKGEEEAPAEEKDMNLEDLTDNIEKMLTEGKPE